MFLPGRMPRPAALASPNMRLAVVFVLALVLAGCGGADGGAGRAIFRRAEAGLARVDALRAHLVVHAPLALERTATIRRGDLPLGRLHLARWARRPQAFACGHGFECARAKLDTEAAVRELEPVLPDLPVDPSSLEAATVEVRLDSRGLRRIDLAGELHGVRVEADLRPAE
jgi:hypothetical protein